MIPKCRSGVVLFGHCTSLGVRSVFRRGRRFSSFFSLGLDACARPLPVVISGAPAFSRVHSSSEWTPEVATNEQTDGVNRVVSANTVTPGGKPARARAWDRKLGNAGAALHFSLLCYLCCVFLSAWAFICFRVPLRRTQETQDHADMYA